MESAIFGSIPVSVCLSAGLGFFFTTTPFNSDLRSFFAAFVGIFFTSGGEMGPGVVASDAATIAAFFCA